MKSKTIIRIIITILTIVALQETISAKPDDLLAIIPKPTKEEKEIISLLQVGKPDFDQMGTIHILVYNPTKYIIKGCVIQVTVPADNIRRVYFSAVTEIRPFTDGVFEVTTKLYNMRDKDFQCDILTLSYAGNKKR